MSKRKKKFLAYFVTLLLPFIILFFPQNYFEPLKMQVVDILALPVRIVLFPFEEAQKVFLYRVTYNRYVKLKKETDLLKSKIISQEGLLEENRRLKALLDFKANSPYPVITANVIGRDPSNWHATVIIDRGQKDGVKQGMPVADASNVIGKISEAGKYVSKVMLLSDPNFSVAALLERSRESGLITGSLQGACRMRYLSPEADIRVGDKVITSQLSTSFPEGFLIGEVTAIEESPSSPTIECLVLPAAHLSQIEEVLVIKK